MPPRFTYWTILIDGQATAFRAHKREDLFPTLVQLQRTNPGAEMKWFARGRIWDSPEAAVEAQRNQRTKPLRSRGPDRRGPQRGTHAGVPWRGSRLPGGAPNDRQNRFKASDKERRKLFARRQRGKKESS
jgi:hypothetical protein